MTTPSARHLSVDGETFTAVPDTSQAGTWHISWDSGPNPGYGFSMAGSDAQWCPETIEAHIRDFLEEIDPETGYLPD